MTDDRPRPKYGEYAPVPPGSQTTFAPLAPPTLAEAIRPPRPVWDVALTTTLLLLGVFDVVTRLGEFSDLAGALRAAYKSQSFPAFTSNDLAQSMGAAINIGRIVVLVLAIVVSLLFIRANRRSFWVPLVGAALSIVIVIVCVAVVVFNDPALAEYVATRTSAS